MFFIISPPSKTEWHVDRVVLLELLKGQWPGIDVSIAQGAQELTTRDVVWRLSTTLGELEGSQNAAGQALYLDGPVSAIARFAAWWRRQVPAQQPLLLYDESYTFVVALAEGVTESDLTAALGVTPAIE